MPLRASPRGGDAHLARVRERFPWLANSTGDNPVDLFNRWPQRGGLVKHPPVPMHSLRTAPPSCETGGWSDMGPARRTVQAPGFEPGVSDFHRLDQLVLLHRRRFQLILEGRAHHLPAHLCQLRPDGAGHQSTSIRCVRQGAGPLAQAAGKGRLTAGAEVPPLVADSLLSMHAGGCDHGLEQRPRRKCWPAGWPSAACFQHGPLSAR